eukprot:GFKZ01008279.1.p1 GENE.GFKZ01008279.1~~GFKZ01008279.1.p1  ORF type:complete len:139 (-),score=10.79 GFKZ01008279.1:251-667(-)
MYLHKISTTAEKKTKSSQATKEQGKVTTKCLASPSPCSRPSSFSLSTLRPLPLTSMVSPTTSHTSLARPIFTAARAGAAAAPPGCAEICPPTTTTASFRAARGETGAVASAALAALRKMPGCKIEERSGNEWIVGGGW